MHSFWRSLICRKAAIISSLQDTPNRFNRFNSSAILYLSERFCALKTVYLAKNTFAFVSIQNSSKITDPK